MSEFDPPVLCEFFYSNKDVILTANMFFLFSAKFMKHGLTNCTAVLIYTGRRQVVMLKREKEPTIPDTAPFL